MTQHPTDDLGLYALGLLDEGERAAIDRHLRTCTTCQRELATHQATVSALADGVAAPVPDVRGAIVAQHRRGSRFVPPVFAYALAVVLAIGLVASLVVLQRERAASDEYARALAAVAQGGRVVALAPSQGTTARGALVVARDGASYLVLQLPAPPSGKGYEAWVIRGGIPTSAGMAPTLSGVVTMPLHESLRTGDAAAITVEDAAGVAAPTTTPILVGEV